MKEGNTMNAPEPSNYTKLMQDTPVDSQNGEHDVIDSAPKRSFGYTYSLTLLTICPDRTYCKWRRSLMIIN